LEVFNHAANLHDGETMAEVLEVNRKHREYVCAACNVELPFNTLVVLTNSGDELVQCVGCQRIMYIAEDLKAALSK
ncbi:MAG: C4-type zinc ribbon domain-containing protein, partial [Planctomycetota bacterium]|nr:C4-type zinc ribbon domain-containing protein [Planctomycetota bacterium]